MKKTLLGIIIFLVANLSYASIIVPMMLFNGEHIGNVKLDDTIYGLLLTPRLKHLPPGVHGFHIHTLPFCEAPGGHLDPVGTHQHVGPYRGNGHLGDLPVLIVDSNGHATLPVLAPRVKLSQIYSHSLVIVLGSDNYSDKPLRQHNSQMQIACGVVPYY